MNYLCFFFLREVMKNMDGGFWRYFVMKIVNSFLKCQSDAAQNARCLIALRLRVLGGERWCREREGGRRESWGRGTGSHGRQLLHWGPSYSLPQNRVDWWGHAFVKCLILAEAHTHRVWPFETCQHLLANFIFSFDPIFSFCDKSMYFEVSKFVSSGRNAGSSICFSTMFLSTPRFFLCKWELCEGVGLNRKKGSNSLSWMNLNFIVHL